MIPKTNVILLSLCSLFSCGQDTQASGGQERLADPIHYTECHKHDTYGAFIGHNIYCMVPIERMEEME